MNCFINACSYCERKIKRSFFDCKNDLTLKLKVKCKKNIFKEDNIYFTVIKKSPFAEEHQPFFFDKNKKIMSPYYKDLSDEIVNDDSLYFKINELKSKGEFLVSEVDTNRFIFKVGDEGEESGGGTNGIPYFIYVEDGGLNYLFKKITKEEDKNTLFGEKYFRIEKSEKSKNLATIPITKLDGLAPTESEIIEIYFLDINTILHVEISSCVIQNTDYVEYMLTYFTFNIGKDNFKDIKIKKEKIRKNESTFEININ